MFEHFFIVGAQRSGTSYLYHLLEEHPEIEMAKPIQPEPKFFLTDSLFERGLEYYQSHFFNSKAGARLRGEKSTSYIESEKVARRIAHCFPEARILFLLRDPIERAISNYYFSVNYGLEKMSIEEAFLQEENRWLNYDPEQTSASPFAYLRRGRYIDYLTMYESYFAAERLKVVVYEQLVKSLSLVQEIYAFLGVAADFAPAAYQKVINKTDKPDFSLSPELTRYLINYFSESNQHLTKRFKLDLSEWRTAG
ncbi:sulfotransferase [Candidatus Omnitrophota bacterium]